MSGPPPKRETQRRRVNKPSTPVTHAASGGCRGPELGGEFTDMARRWWSALRRSGQAQFYEESDWAQAEVLVHAIDSFVRKPSATMLMAINSMSSALLVTEGDRRRLRLELDRAPEAESEFDAAVTRLSEYQRSS